LVGDRGCAWWAELSQQGTDTGKAFPVSVTVNWLSGIKPLSYFWTDIYF